MRNWAGKYIGKPYRAGARGPDFFDCWGLPYFVLREDFYTEIPTFPIHPQQLDQVAGQFSTEEKSNRWVQLSVPEEGCLVPMSHHTKFHHVGLYTEADGGLVIHALDGSGVVADSLRRLSEQGWNRIEFYAPASWHV